jgi:hypothetical protein
MGPRTSGICSVAKYPGEPPELCRVGQGRSAQSWAAFDHERRRASSVSKGKGIGKGLRLSRIF